MSKPEADGAAPRYIPSGSCSWCGHKPHDAQACRGKIRTRAYRAGVAYDNPQTPCPCGKQGDQ